MPGKPITLAENEYYILSQTKKDYEKSKGESVDWGRFLLFLLHLYIRDEVIKAKKNDK